MELNQFNELTAAELRDEWKRQGVRGDPPHFKQALVRGIAWHLQEQTHSKLDAGTRRLLKAAIRKAPMPASRQPSNTHRKKRDHLSLPAGTTLVRSWRDRRHEVTVLEGGRRFRYRDTEYASLSEIAREITGTRWSGPRFFGLKKLKQSA